MTQIHWTNPVDGSFTNAADWTGGVVPGAGDVAILDAAGATPYTVTLSAYKTTIAGFQTAADATFSIASASVGDILLFDLDGTAGGANAGHLSVTHYAEVVASGTFDNEGGITLGGDNKFASLIVGSTHTSHDLELIGGGTVTEGRSCLIGGYNLTNIDNTISGYIKLELRTLDNQKSAIIESDIRGGSQHVRAIGSIYNSGIIESVSGELGVYGELLANSGTIEGIGVGGVGLYGKLLANSGTIEGIGAGSVGLAGSIVNTGQIKISGSGGLRLSGTLDDSGGGVFDPGSKFELYGGKVVGGSLTIAAGAVMDATDSGALNTDLVNQGGIRIHSRGSLTIQGSITNAGTINLAGQAVPVRHHEYYAFTADLVAGPGGLSLAGGGKVTMTDSGVANIVVNNIIGAGAVQTLTNLDNTISGAGLVGGSLLDVVNEATAVIDANAGVNPLILDASAGPIVNAGLIETTGAGGLVLRNGTVANTGTIEAIGLSRLTLSFATVDDTGGGVFDPGRKLTLTNGAVVGGSLTVAKGSILTAKGVAPTATTADTLATALTNNGVIVIVNDTSLAIQGAVVNTGFVELIGINGTTTLAIDSAGATLTGGGIVRMNVRDSNLITGASPGAVLDNIDNIIVGAGRIGGGSLTLVNGAAGIIAAVDKLAGLTLDTGANLIVNDGLIKTLAAGGVSIEGAIDNEGRLEAIAGTLTANGAVTGAGEGVIAGGTLDFASSFDQRVVFLAAGGVLEMAQSQGYTGPVSGFSKTGASAFDLRDIGFVGAGEASFSGTAAGGVLSVSDGTHTAHIQLQGDYTASAFVAGTDGAGGTTVVASAAPPLNAMAQSMAGLGAIAAGALGPTSVAPVPASPLLAPPAS